MDYAVSLGLGGTLGLAGAAWFRWRHRLRRDAHYARLSSREREVQERFPVTLSANLPPSPMLAGQFQHERIVRVGECLEEASLVLLSAEAQSARSAMERSYVPLHKQGNTLAYERAMALAPRCWSLYCSPQFIDWLSGVTGVPMLRPPVQDQSAMSLLCYDHPGDHIQWHYDHNFYRGRHFTVLLSLHNRGAGGGPSRSVLQRLHADQRIEEFDTSENSLVIFEGACVRHRATPIIEGDLRLMLSMTYCSDARNSAFQEGLRRIKDTAFFGIRALWD